MRDQKMDFNTAFNYVKSRRPRIEPNQGFLKQLQQWEITLQKNQTIQNTDVINYPCQQIFYRYFYSRTLTFGRLLLIEDVLLDLVNIVTKSEMIIDLERVC